MIAPTIERPTTTGLVERLYGRPRRSGDPTDKQLNYLLRLAGDRQAPTLGTDGEERMENMGAKLENRQPTGREVSTWLSWLERQPLDRPAPTDGEHRQQQLVGIGVYELPDGRIYVVKPTKDKSRVYALRLVESPDRLNEADEHVPFDFEYERGGIYQLRPEHRMSAERAKHFMVRYGRCIVCKKTLTAAKSVEQGVGPVCRKYFG